MSNVQRTRLLSSHESKVKILLPTGQLSCRQTIGYLLNIKQPLQVLRNKTPLVFVYLISVELFQTIDARTRYLRVQRILLFQLTAVHWLIAAFDLDGNGRLALLADGQLLVVAFDARSVQCQVQ